MLGENANLVDFFAYLKRGGFQGIIVNASPYAVVNAKMVPPLETYGDSCAESAASRLLAWFSKSSEIRESSLMRVRFLEAIALALMPQKSKPLVIDASEAWKSGRYRKALQEAIEFCSECRLEGEPLRIRKYANYNRYDTDYQRWYSVLVVAEAIYMKDVFGANAKLGPTSESNFDKLLGNATASRKTPLGFVWYDRTVEKEISVASRISFSDTESRVREKLDGSPRLSEWMAELVSAFYVSDSDLAKSVWKMVREVGLAAKSVRLPALVEGGFFTAFPPGECD
jgi:hypothetical protein